MPGDVTSQYVDNHLSWIDDSSGAAVLDSMEPPVSDEGLAASDEEYIRCYEGAVVKPVSSFTDDLTGLVFVLKREYSPASGWCDSDDVSFHVATFWVSRDSELRGEGCSRAKAVRDHCRKIARRFQELYRKLPEEMDVKEASDWNLLLEGIDIEKTLAAWPTRARQAVEVVADHPWKVLPYGGVEADIELEDAPDGFERLKAGDWITAVCVYDAETHELIGIESMRPREPMPKLTASEAKEMLKSMRKTSGLPPIDWSDI